MPPARRQPAIRAEVEVELLEALLGAASEILMLVDSGGAIRSSFGADLLHASSGLQGRPLADVVDPKDAHRVRHLLARVAGDRDGGDTIETRMKFGDSSWRAVELLVRNRLERTPLNAVVVVVRDVSERQAREAQLREDALHDPLTELPNRTLFTDRLALALQRRRRSNDSVAVLFVDIDDFKSVNDQLGHRAGDELMVAIAGRLNRGLRSSDTAARLGGDEFAILLDPADETDATHVADRILAAFDEPFMVEGESRAITASVGIATSFDPSDSGSELLRRADLAMYAAKMRDRKGGYEVFQPRTEAALRAAQYAPDEPATDPVNVVRLHRAQRERAEIRELLDSRASIRSEFQAVIELRTGRVAGYEALSRFPTLDRAPDSVFDQAHRCGLGSFLEAMAIQSALRAAGRPDDTFLAVNVSPTALMSREVARALPHSLDEIVIEVTEQELAPETDLVQEGLALARSRGGRVAIDDAGAGYAGLRHLTDLSPDMIKIDGGLIRGGAHDLHKGALVESLVSYARRIGASTCAEGVERHEDLEFARATGVDLVQGYLLARPGEPWNAPDEAEVERLLAAGAEAGIARPAGSARERLAAVLARAESWREVDHALGIAAITLAVERIYLSRFHPVERYVTLVAAHGHAQYDIPYPLSEYPVTAQVIDELEPRHVDVHDPAADPHEVELLLTEGMATGLLHPVVHEGACVGLLEISSRREREWTEQELLYLSHVADRLGETMARLGARAPESPGRR
jgi:diguanylate cyclase (GGDEF)-like protein